MPDLEPNVYSSLVAARNTYLQLNWNRSQLLLTLHIIALPIFFNTSTQDKLLFVISCVSLFSTIMLFGMITQVLLTIKFIDSKLVEIERSNCDDGKTSTVIVFSDPKFARLSRYKYPIAAIFIFGSIAMIAFWACQSIKYSGLF